MWGGIAGYMGATPIENIGNHVYFGDPLMSTMDYAKGIAFSGLTGGISNGLLAKINGKNIWNGSNNGLINEAQIDAINRQMSERVGDNIDEV